MYRQVVAYGSGVKEPSMDNPSPSHEPDSFEPKGTLTFVVLLAIGYAIYWFVLWFDVVSRGGTQ